MREAETLGIVTQHPNVLTFYGLTQLESTNRSTTARWGIVTEFMNLGSLEDILYGSEPLSGQTSISRTGRMNSGRNSERRLKSMRKALRSVDLIDFARQTASGVASLHSKGIIHRDLACRNILANGHTSTNGAVPRDSRGVARIRVCVADFGLSARLSAETPRTGNSATSQHNRGYAKGIGAIRWEAPEVWSRPGKRLFSRASDVYAFGVCLYEMFVGHQPWNELRDNKSVVDAVRSGQTMHIPHYVDTTIAALMRRCWSFEPSSRPSMLELESALAARIVELNGR